MNRSAALGLPLFVVNDGATDDTPNVLARWKDDARIRVVIHPINRGKAAALRTGFATASEQGFTHAVTMDSDGQLNCNDIPAMVAAARPSPTALVIGTRDSSAADYPCRDPKRGRTASNFFVKLESGLRVSDSQCGLRVYPLAFATRLRCTAERFGFKETEIITRTGWAGGSICRSARLLQICRAWQASQPLPPLGRFIPRSLDARKTRRPSVLPLAARKTDRATASS